MQSNEITSSSDCTDSYDKMHWSRVVARLKIFMDMGDENGEVEWSWNTIKSFVSRFGPDINHILYRYFSSLLYWRMDDTDGMDLHFYAADNFMKIHLDSTMRAIISKHTKSTEYNRIVRRIVSDSHFYNYNILEYYIDAMLLRNGGVPVSFSVSIENEDVNLPMVVWIIKCIEQANLHQQGFYFVYDIKDRVIYCKIFNYKCEIDVTFFERRPVGLQIYVIIVNK